MGETKHHRDAERILLALDANTNPMATSDLAQAAGLDKTQQVHYRCTGQYKHALVDAGQVQKHPPEDGKEAQWLLTPLGRDWLREHKDDIQIPQTEEEAIEVCQRALSKSKAAESTASTVQGEFSQVKREAQTALEEIEGLREETQEIVESSESWAREAAEEGAAAVYDDLREDVDSIKEETQEELHDLSVKHDRLKRKLSEVRENVDGVDSRDLKSYSKELRADVDENSGDIGHLHDRVDELSEQLDDQDEAISAVNNKFNRLDRTLTMVDDRLKDVEEALEELDEESESGLFDDLL